MKKKCKCAVTQDGECETCKASASTAGVRFQEVLSQFILSYKSLEAEFTRKIMETKKNLGASAESFGAVGSCDRCNNKYIDFAISKIISGLKEEDPRFGIAFAVSFVKNAREKFEKRGVRHFPLTEKALAEIQNNK